MKKTLRVNGDQVTWQESGTIGKAWHNTCREYRNKKQAMVKLLSKMIKAYLTFHEFCIIRSFAIVCRLYTTFL